MMNDELWIMNYELWILGMLIKLRFLFFSILIPYTLYLIPYTLYLIPYTLYFIPITFLSGCGGDDYTPKPRGFFRIDLPEKAYKKYDSICPFSFEYPVYSKVLPDLDNNAEPCWIDVDYPRFKGRLNLSYKPVNGNLVQLLEDSRTLINKHIPKAEGIEEQLISNTQARVFGLVYEVQGTAAASPLQFVLTDSTHHFLRGALYFSVVPNNDSLAPVIDFIKQDISHMIASFKWKWDLNNYKINYELHR